MSALEALVLAGKGLNAFSADVPRKDILCVLLILQQLAAGPA
jgi:hypothetical protein